jgi:hypothetical protein
MSQEKSVSGIIIPSYNDSNTRGFSLQNGGYYFALSDQLRLNGFRRLLYKRELRYAI